MNRDRRKRIQAIIDTLQEAVDLLADVDIESIRDEEQETFDNMPEGLQQSERGQMTEEAASNLDNATDALDTVRDSLDEILSNLNDAAA